MSQPLDPTQKKSVEATLDFLERLIACYAPHADKTKDQLDDLRATVADLRDMLNSGKIDIQTAGINIKAETDRGGIHLNDQSTYSMPGDYLLNDCKEGYFESLWTMIEVLLHERHHYHHTTGIWGGGFRSILDLDCIGCKEQHALGASEAAQRQDPNSTYGN